MSQTDQAFIKAYRQQASGQSTQQASAFAAGNTRQMPGGTQVRIDGSHAAPARISARHYEQEQAQQEVVATTQSASGAAHDARVPTPHLQLALGGNAWLDGVSNTQKALHQTAVAVQQGCADAKRTDGSVESKQTAQQPAVSAKTQATWAPRFRTHQRQRPTPQQEPTQSPTPSVQPAVRTNAPKCISNIEQTLMGLEGVDAGDGKAADQTPQGEPTLRIVNDAVEPEETTDNAAAQSPVIFQSTPDAADRPEDASAGEVDLREQTEVSPEMAPPEAGEGNDNATVAESEDSLPTDEHEQTPEEGEEPSEGLPSEDAPTEAFQAIWEVDEFHWPEVMEQLWAASANEIGAAGETIAEQAAAGDKLLAVAGVHEYAGATTLALALAQALAKQGKRVALVDADFERPMLAERLGVRVEDGWEAALEGKLPLEEVCISSLGDGVTLVPLMNRDNVSATNASMSAAKILRQLAGAFDIVLIDAGSGSENVAAVTTSSDETLGVTVLLAEDHRKQDTVQTKEIIDNLQKYAIGSICMAQTFVAG